MGVGYGMTALLNCVTIQANLSHQKQKLITGLSVRWSGLRVSFFDENFLELEAIKIR